MLKLVSLFVLVFCGSLLAQSLPDEFETTFNEGVNLEHKQTNFKSKFRFRIQGRMTYETEDAEDLSPEMVDFTVRRMRLRFDGSVLDPRFLYRVQLSFTRGDMDFDRTEYPNILRDAVVGWKLLPHTIFWYGQTKLPGNRQRLVSSGSQQFVDRSLLNATFNIDRDLGAQLHHRQGNEQPIWIKLAISNGEGRATDNKDDGLSYTARLEWLPLGTFHDDGDYFEADLFREPEPRFSIGAAYNLNKKTTRPGGQLGTQYETEGIHRDLETQFIDALFKYRGFSWTAEYAHRWAHKPVFNDGPDLVGVYKGEGFNTQAGYVFENNIEPALRYTVITANKDAQAVSNNQKEYTFALSKYINRHTVKIQGDMTYIEEMNPSQDLYDSSWRARLQVEIGI